MTVLTTDERADLVLPAVVERLERAAGPDRALDIAILRATDANGYLIEDDGTILVSGDQGDGPGWFNIGYDVPEFTASLDAARKLIPAGFYWLASEGKTRDSEPLGGAQVFRPTYLVKPIAEAEHETVEIALCIAALKARSILAEEHAHGRDV